MDPPTESELDQLESERVDRHQLDCLFGCGDVDNRRFPTLLICEVWDESR